MEIIYKIGDFPDPGDGDVFNGIQEINKNNYREALKHFEKGSTYDNEYALLFSAAIYFTGVGIDKREPAKAMNFCEKAVSEWKNSVAQYLMGLMYCDGEGGVPMDRETAARFFLSSAEQGWPYAIAIMGDLFRGAIPSKTDEKKAIIWLEKIAKKDNNETEMIKDETFYLFGNKNLVVDFTHANQKVIKLVKERCLDEGFISPVKGVRDLYLLPDDPDCDEYQRIIVWNLLTEKESSGVVACQLRLPKLYLDEGNLPKAIYWTKMAAKNESAQACSKLGTFYKDGLGVKQDYKKAIKWYSKSTNLGSGDGAYRLGVMHYEGLGVKKDCKLALAFFKLKLTLPIDRFEYFTYYYMGEIHQLGKDGVPQDYKAAYDCYKTAFELGCVMGAVRIAAFYCRGLGVKKDPAKTIEWLLEAASNDAGCYCGGNLLNIIDQKGFKAAEPFIIEKLYSDCYIKL